MSSKINPRTLAVKALCRVDSEGAFSNITLNSLLKEYELSPEDKALCTTIFYGTLDRRITLDFILKQFVKSGFNKIKPFTLNLLRSAVYQIKYMDKIPDSAAVNESVKIIKASKESYGAGFVNGVLRNIVRTDLALPEGHSVADISVRYSCPEWIVDELVSCLSAATAEEFLKYTLLPPPTYIHANTGKITADALSEALSSAGVTVSKTDTDNALVIAGYSALESMNAYKQGLFHVQDISCQRAINMLAIKNDDRIFDMCSAPGGKAYTAALSAENVSIVAADIYEHRVGLVLSGAKRLGLLNIKTTVSDATVFDPQLGLFDKVICDVPCSGLGVIRRKPDIKYRKPEDMDKLREIQIKILENADAYLKAGGRLLYSTCTLRKAENEEIVEAFIAGHKNYKLVEMKTFLPQYDNSDGFYAAVLQKD